ncbi:5-oxoprolinase subunit PxpA [Metabacillus halosaccharovorans]|uniref:5-oxoprolinase subunit A n=1 Tax=Metabacillus halosaccharovorans TaxID=930124 RepID=A0ABT3DBM7_9BACI|nr:5-oxoprolinase subunit PxpA [Metabacillus halosaccharovorans]MCV9884342.1 LamB/YcsF family protein [Metabacillus halosaccharovorans]
MKIDINCDMGESFGAYKIGADEEIIHFISSANIACGFHAGDPATMRKTVKLAQKYSVKIGAHPGFEDMKGFGRRNISISPEEAFDLVVYQIGALSGFVTAEGGTLHHVKPHGALYNMAALDRKLAEAIAEAVYKVNPELILYGLSESELIRAGEKLGLRTASEVFADRTYQKNGMLTPRVEKNALIKKDELAIKQVLTMVLEQKVVATNGEKVSIKADTICIHGDGEYAASFARLIYNTLQENGVKIKGV